MLKKLVEPNKLLLDVCNSRFFEKKGQNLFFTGTIAFFWKDVSIDLLGSTVLNIETCTKIVKTLSRTLYFVPQDWFYSLNEKKYPEVFFLWNKSLFFQNIFVFNSLLGVEGKILELTS